jgi:hypothetical protein
MTTTRHRATARLAARFSKPSWLAVLSSTATVTVVALGVTGAASPDAVEGQAAQQSTSLGATSVAMDLKQFAELRDPRTSRTAPRVALQPKATGHKFATAALNIWTAPREQGQRLGLLEWGTKVAVTGQVTGHWAEVLLTADKRQVVRWVNADYLANNKPKPEKVETSSDAPSTGTSTGGISTAPCADGSSVESGLTAGAIAVYRAVCAAFPEPTTYGGYDGHGEHADGRAIDIMTSGDMGYQIAEWLRANAGALGIRDIIYSQRIWTPEQASAGWRYMSDRGSTTANHYDHVHVAVF